MRVLIVDDDRRFLPLLERGFRYEGYDVATATTGAEGIELVRQFGPDVLVLDIGMPAMDGFEVLRRVRGLSDVPVVMLTARDEVADKVNALGLGADDYVPKPFAFDELVARIRAVLRRRDVAADPVLTFSDLRLDLGTRETTRGGNDVELTAKEFELLVHFLRNPRRVQSREALLRAIWGFDREVDTNVVDVTVGHLRRKLGEPRLLQTVWGVGYVLRE